MATAKPMDPKKGETRRSVGTAGPVSEAARQACSPGAVEEVDGQDVPALKASTAGLGPTCRQVVPRISTNNPRASGLPTCEMDRPSHAGRGQTRATAIRSAGTIPWNPSQRIGLRRERAGRWIDPTEKGPANRNAGPYAFRAVCADLTTPWSWRSAPSRIHWLPGRMGRSGAGRVRGALGQGLNAGRAISGRPCGPRSGPSGRGSHRVGSGG